MKRRNVVKKVRGGWDDPLGVLSKNEPNLVRDGSKRKSDPLAFCEWAAGLLEAKFFAFTPDHDKQRAAQLKQMNTPAWFKFRPRPTKKFQPKRERKVEDDE